MTIRLILVLTIVFSFIKSFGQNQPITDILGATYIIENQEIIKTENFKQYKYKNILLGKISKLDVINPLQILVYYKQQNIIVLLDKNLTEISVIDINLTNPSLQTIYTGLSIKNNIWIFDIISKRFGLLSINDRSFRFITNTINSNLTWIASDLNNLYYVTDLNELYEVDIYGKINFIKPIPNNSSLYFNLNQFEIIDNETNKTIYRFEIQKGKVKKLDTKSTKNE